MASEVSAVELAMPCETLRGSDGTFYLHMHVHIQKRQRLNVHVTSYSKNYMLKIVFYFVSKQNIAVKEVLWSG